MAARGENPGRWMKGLGIDLGTANTIMYVCGQGVVVREPTVIAVDRRRSAVVALGREAKEMVGRTPRGVETVRPVRGGVIAELELAEVMPRQWVARTQPRWRLLRPPAAFSIPWGMTEVERRAMRGLAEGAGLRQVRLIEEPVAAAIGAGLKVWEPRAAMVMNIGGGTCEVAVIAMNGIVGGRSLRLGGEELDAAIVGYLRRELNLEIGGHTAEWVKQQIGSAYPLNGEEGSLLVRGRDVLSGLPAAVQVEAGQIREAICGPLARMVEAVMETLEVTPPELAADLMEGELVLTGGGSLLRGMDRLITRQTGLRVRVAEHPAECAAIGAGRALEDVRYAEALSE